MPMTPFFERFPELGPRETRSVTVRGMRDLPDGEYGFIELYCNEPHCDCRRVMVVVLRPETGWKRFWATINSGWESREFYQQWAGAPGWDESEWQGPFLDPCEQTCALICKEVSPVYWRRGAARLPLRLFIVAPTAYRKRKGAKLCYRQPAYLLSTDLKTSAKQLLEICFDRCQIEVNHREEKETLGLGQAQLRNVKAVPKQAALVVAAYSALLLASLQAFGMERGKAYPVLPRWRRNASRPSCLDSVTLRRKEMVGHPDYCRWLSASRAGCIRGSISSALRNSATASSFFPV